MSVGLALLVIHTQTFWANRYRLAPMGSTSKIEKVTGDKATYEL